MSAQRVWHFAIKLNYLSALEREDKYYSTTALFMLRKVDIVITMSPIFCLYSEGDKVIAKKKNQFLCLEKEVHKAISLNLIFGLYSEVDKDIEMNLIV